MDPLVHSHLQRTIPNSHPSASCLPIACAAVGRGRMGTRVHHSRSGEMQRVDACTVLAQE
jgi:hypothetical protein